MTQEKFKIITIEDSIRIKYFNTDRAVIKFGVSFVNNGISYSDAIPFNVRQNENFFFTLIRTIINV